MNLLQLLHEFLLVLITDSEVKNQPCCVFFGLHLLGFRGFSEGFPHVPKKYAPNSRGGMYLTVGPPMGYYIYPFRYMYIMYNKTMNVNRLLKGGLAVRSSAVFKPVEFENSD
jgi:hypothetical protein